MVNENSSKIGKYYLPLPTDKMYLSEVKDTHAKVIKAVFALKSKGFRDVKIVEKKVYEEVEERELEIKVNTAGELKLK